ncbi:hypothetical protein C8R45DRAFT_1173737, partial [Mycena sanguinolenta]
MTPSQEFIDLIVSLVPDKASLLSCALTAAAFVNPSQRRIFYSMSIQDVAAYQRLADILAHSPHLGQYIRFLVFEIEGELRCRAPLQSILSTTTRLERLTIEGIRILNDGRYPSIWCGPSFDAFPSLKFLPFVYLLCKFARCSLVSPRIGARHFPGGLPIGDRGSLRV